MKITTKQMTFAALLTALYVVLSYFSFGTNNFSISVKTLSILLAAVLLGPLSGLTVGGLGEFLSQMLHYGIDITTPLWLIPYAVMGLSAALLVKKSKPDISPGRLIFACAISELVLTALVTPVNIVSGLIQGWMNWATFGASTFTRIGIMLCRIVIDAIIVPLLYKALRKAVK